MKLFYSYIKFLGGLYCNCVPLLNCIENSEILHNIYIVLNNIWKWEIKEKILLIKCKNMYLHKPHKNTALFLKCWSIQFKIILHFPS